jgi:hypothetical protein
MMRKRLQARMYTNAILTVIALCLLALVIHDYRLSVASNAYAVEQILGQPRTPGYSAPGRGAPVDTTNVAQTQDTAVAAATSDVAAANRDIATAIRELAEGVKAAGASIAKASATSAAPAAAVTK